jgi:hypothetical protein
MISAVTRDDLTFLSEVLRSSRIGSVSTPTRRGAYERFVEDVESLVYGGTQDHLLDALSRFLRRLLSLTTSTDVVSWNEERLWLVVCIEACLSLDRLHVLRAKEHIWDIANRFCFCDGNVPSAEALSLLNEIIDLIRQ